ncbi:MAG: O-antigen ligase family protein, partial [Candidatus Omnitrophica bacterium]|nr:O-antigen ligase family protein [Candidatus Omnitrophota bacterium]
FWRRLVVHSSNTMKMPIKKHFFLTTTFKVLMIVVFILIVVCLGVTYSRSTWLAVLTSLFILFFKKPKILMSFFVCSVIFISLFVFKMYQERTHPVKEYNTDTVVRVEVIDQNFFNPTGRVELWRQAWEVIKKRPLFGVGLNAYTKAAAQYTEINWDGYPHNSFLQIWAETGFFGFAAFLWILVRLFKTTYHVIIHIQDEFHHALLIGLTYGFLAFLIQAFFDTTLYSVQLGALMWLIIGFIVAIPKVVLRGEEGDKISSYSFH